MVECGLEITASFPISQMSDVVYTYWNFPASMNLNKLRFQVHSQTQRLHDETCDFSCTSLVVSNLDFALYTPRRTLLACAEYAFKLTKSAASLSDGNEHKSERHYFNETDVCMHIWWTYYSPSDAEAKFIHQIQVHSPINCRGVYVSFQFASNKDAVRRK